MHVVNLYLNTHGIVHSRAHPEEGPQQQNKEKMFDNMEALIDWLVLAFRLHALLYIALEDTVPLSKVNQQYTQRFCLVRAMVEAVDLQR
jgi:5'-3' exonuclease